VLLNRLEYALMNNPIRAFLQQTVEARRLLRLGGRIRGNVALEIGCGRGVGTELILDIFGADRVDAFDLDPRMVAQAESRLRARGSRVRIWAGDATRIAAPDGVYDAVFDFGIIHHVPDWRRVLSEVARVLRPGGRFYAEEVLRDVIVHPFVRRLLAHPQADRFDQADFLQALQNAGLRPVASETFAGAVAWFVADRPEAE
jgi:ubiquinone/menaquinone biosynthesis C-methylase UbiE